jgi:hypothetical protein
MLRDSTLVNLLMSLYVAVFLDYLVLHRKQVVI